MYSQHSPRHLSGLLLIAALSLWSITTAAAEELYQGEWYSLEQGYAFRFRNDTGITLYSVNAAKAGEIMLTIESRNGQHFVARHLFSDGRWHQVDGQFVDPYTLRFSRAGQHWYLKRFLAPR